MSDAPIEIGQEALEKELAGLSIDSPQGKNGEERVHKKRLPTAERIRLWEEEQAAKKTTVTGLHGKVKWYSVRRRYGFISRDDGEKDVFVHQTAIAKSGTEKFYLRTLGDEEEVLFDLVDGKNGPEAANVSGPEGENVIGSRYRHTLLSRFRKNRKQRDSVDGEEAVKEKKTQEESPLDTSEDVTKKQKRPRKNRTRKPKASAHQEKGAGDAANESAEPASLANSSPDAKVSKMVGKDEPGLSKIDRCDSALGDAGLGAQSIDAQI